MGRMNNEPYQTYDTSLEIVRLDAFRRDDVREWYKEVTDDVNLIYKYRWGESCFISNRKLADECV